MSIEVPFKGVLVRDKPIDKVADLEKDVRLFKSKFRAASNKISVLQAKLEKCLDLAFVANDIELVYDLYEDTQVEVEYEAIEGTYTNKRGVTSKCYNSVYGKYAGTKPVVLKYYTKFSAQDFHIDPITRKILYKHKFIKDVFKVVNPYEEPVKEEVKEESDSESESESDSDSDSDEE